MSKKFLDTFPTISYQDVWRDLLSMVEVQYIQYSRDKTSIRVYVESPRLIQKPEIRELEELLQKQLFGEQGLGVQIVEHFSLSAQYTPGKLLEAYKDSILEDFRTSSVLECNLCLLYTSRCV